MYIDEQIKGTIYFVDGSTFDFTTSDIIDDDVSILQQATPDDSFSVGGTYSATLNMTIHIPAGLTNSYDIIGSKVVLKSKYGTESDFVNRGIFWVTSATRYKDIYTVSGSDAITWLDTIPYLDQTLYDNNNEPYNNEVYHKMMYSVVNLATKLGDILQVVNDYLQNNNINEISLLQYNQQDITNNDNGFCVLPSSLTGENATHCPRDYSSWLSQLSCGFIQCFYNDTTSSYVGFGNFDTTFSDTLQWENFEQDTLEIASFEIKFSKVYAEIYNGVINATDTLDFGLNSIELDLSGNAFLDGHYQYSSNIDDDAYRTSVPLLESIRTFLNTLNIRPFSGVYHGEKRFRLGQCVKIIDENQLEYLTTLTKIQWNFRGGYEIGCAGKDNRVLFDSARRTPSIRAKEQALTKTNYAIKKAETGLQANIDYVDEKLTSKVEDTEGQTMNVQDAVNYAHQRIDSAENRLDKIEKWIADQGGTL